MFVFPDPKDPDCSELYGFDFATVLQENEIDPATVSGHQVLVPAGLTLHSSRRDGAAIRARVAGGTAGEVYKILFRLLVADPDAAPTAPPLAFDKTLQIRVEHQ